MSSGEAVTRAAAAVTAEDLVGRWEGRATELEPYNAGAAHALRECAAQLQRVLQAADGDVLTLKEAAAASGYSFDWLQKQVAAGEIPNAGRKGKPAIRRADLPRKPGHPLPAAPAEGHFRRRRRIVLDARPQPHRSA